MYTLPFVSRESTPGTASHLNDPRSASCKLQLCAWLDVEGYCVLALCYSSRGISMIFGIAYRFTCLLRLFNISGVFWMSHETFLGMDFCYLVSLISLDCYRGKFLCFSDRLMFLQQARFCVFMTL